MAQGERLQVGQQPLTQRVDDPLAHVDLHLRVDHPDDLAAELHQHPCDDHNHQQRRGAAPERAWQETGEERGQRRISQHVVHHHLERPGRQRGQAYFHDREDRDGQSPPPIGAQERQGPGDKSHQENSNSPR